MYNLNYTPTTLGYKLEEKLHLGVREQKRLNITVPEDSTLRQCGLVIQDANQAVPEYKSTYVSFRLLIRQKCT
jgi:hypothetical protein